MWKRLTKYHFKVFWDFFRQPFLQFLFTNFFPKLRYSNGFGEVMQRSFGIWHTKCFPKETPPTLEELEDLCKKLGFKNSAKAIGRITNLKIDSRLNELDSKNSSDGIPVEFQMFNATKVVTYTRFAAVKINDGFTVHLRPSKPLAKLVSWDENDHEKCHRMELKCVENWWKFSVHYLFYLFSTN